MKVSSIASSFLLLCTSSSVMAHFILDYPVSRGFNDDAEPNAPCGGFDSAPTNRSMFPITNGFVDINSFRISTTIVVNIALGNNPAAADFTAAAAKPASPATSINHPGHSCLSFNLTSFAGAANNTNVTIQVVYNGGDGILYQCADIVLVTSAPSFDMKQCIVGNGASANATSSGSAPASTGMPSSAAKLTSGVVAGVLGMVAVAVAMV